MPAPALRYLTTDRSVCDSVLSKDDTMIAEVSFDDTPILVQQSGNEAKSLEDIVTEPGLLTQQETAGRRGTFGHERH